MSAGGEIIADPDLDEGLYNDGTRYDMADLSIRDQGIRTFMSKKGTDMELMANLRSPAMFNFVQQMAILHEGFGVMYAGISKDRLLRLTASYQARNRDDIRTICTSDSSGMGMDMGDAPGNSDKIIGAMAQQGNYDLEKE